MLHLATLLGCSTTDIQYISNSHSLPANTTASEVFYGVDIIYTPMIEGIFALIIAIIFGVIFAYVYKRLPGIKSSTKGVTLGVFTFVVVAFAGPGYFLDYACSAGPFPIVPFLTFVLSIPVALLFGYLLGSFFDSFGRLETEETEERRKMQEATHWSELFRRKPKPENNNNDKSVEESETKET